MKEIIDDMFQEELSKNLESSLNWNIVGQDREAESLVHEILTSIINIHKNGTVGVVNGLEGGLTIDYIHKDTKEEWRFTMGFTELGYWVYCNIPKSKLKLYVNKK